MEKPKPPIFIVDGFDIAVFPSVEDAEHHFEPRYFDPGDQAAYDAEGRLIRLEGTGNDVLARLAEDEPTHAAELAGALRAYLKEMKEPAADDPTCDLPCLVDACRRFISSPPTVGDFLRWVRRAARGIFRR